jgi:hypothetical protein
MHIRAHRAEPAASDVAGFADDTGIAEAPKPLEPLV